MKFYIVRGEKVEFRLQDEPVQPELLYFYNPEAGPDPGLLDGGGGGMRRSGEFQVTKLLPVPTDKESQQSQVAKIIQQKVETALQQQTPADSEEPGSASKRARLQGNLNPGKSTFGLELTYNPDPYVPEVGYHRTIRTTDTSLISVTGISKGLLGHFKNHFQLEPAQIKAKVTGQLWLQRRIPGGGEANSMRAFGTVKTMAKCLHNHGDSGDDSYKFEDTSARLTINTALSNPNRATPRSLWSNPLIAFSGTFSVELILDGVNEHFFTDSSVSDRMSINRKLLQDPRGMGSDIKIVTDNGVIIQCHKGFLAAHSQVFTSMLNGNFVEAEKKEIKLPGKTEEAIRALLAYLYCWDTTAAVDDPLIAVELYTIAHEYDIKSLQNCMAKLLGKRKPEDWLDTETALALFPFVGSLDDSDGMKCAIYRYFKKNAKKLGESESFREMFQKTPSTAIYLFGEVCGWKDSN